jgi:predicted nucleic acid-binding protein
MSGTKLLIDTNIALYLLGGNQTIQAVLDKNTIFISFITQLELLGYKGITDLEKNQIKNFIKDCVIIDINDEIKIKTIEIKEKVTIKLPDAIIAATSIVFDLPLLSADKGLIKIENLNLILFED